MELAALLKQHESKTLEFKRDLSSPAGVLRSLVAFANTAGGTLLIGVEDGTRRVRGLADPLAEEERLVNLVSDGIEPRLMPDIEVLPWRRTQVLAVQVQPSAARPHHLKSAGAAAGVYVRVGSTNRRADAELVEELRRQGRGLPFDEQPALMFDAAPKRKAAAPRSASASSEIDSEALDFRAASECFAPVRQLRRRDLQTLRLLVPHQGRLVPSIGGMLLFGHARETAFPDAWMQAGRFEGTDRSTMLDEAALRGPLPRIVEAAIEFVGKHEMRGFTVGRLRRQPSGMLPPVALREALINAVVHADYAQRGAPLRLAIFDDRVEIENPGLLLPGLALEDLRRGVSKLRNRVIGRVFHELGLIEQWGSGIQRMTRACREVGLPEPQLEEVGLRFRVTLFRTATRAAAVVGDDIDLLILGALTGPSGRDGLSTQEVAQLIERSSRTARLRLASLVDRGLVMEVGSSPQDPRRRYVKAAKR